MTDFIDPSSAVGIWRYHSCLPKVDPKSIVSLGEGNTPLLPLTSLAAELGIATLAAKAEHMNPTGSFKDRIASVAMSLVVERGLAGCLGTSSGNGGAAIAAYAARARRRSVLFTLADIPAEKLRQIRALGADVNRLEGMEFADNVWALVEAVPSLARSHGYLPFITAFRYMPEAMEGAKTIAFELAVAIPQATAVYVPIGGGGLLTAIHQGYVDVCDHFSLALPRLVGVQPSGCATMSRALRNEEPVVDQVLTTISGLQVAVLLDADGVTEAVRESGGHAVVVDDPEIWEAQHLLAREGLLVEPAGATALAGALADVRAGRLAADDQVVVVLSGAGWKDGSALNRLAGSDEIPTITPAQIPRILEMAPN